MEGSQEYRDRIIRRIAECEEVIRDLEGSAAWRVVVADMERQRKYLDDHWQDITDEQKLQKARELKFAVLHILNLKKKYEEELEGLKKELEAIDKPEEVIAKDYDNETITEEG